MSIEESHGRRNLISALRNITSPSMQAAWIEGDEKQEWLFDLAVVTLLDDWGILDHPLEMVGDTSADVFKTDVEARSCHEVAVKLNLLVESLGKADPREYVLSAEWQDLATSAEKTLELLSANP